jgi:hypothetical protein
MIDSTWLSVMPTSMLLMLAAEGPLFAPPHPATIKDATRANARRNFNTGSLVLNPKASWSP